MNSVVSRIAGIVCAGALVATASPMQAMADGTRDAQGHTTMLGSVGATNISKIAAEDPDLARDVKAVAANTVEQDGTTLIFNKEAAIADGASSDFANKFESNLQRLQTGSTQGANSQSAPAAPTDARVDCIVAQLGVSVSTAGLWITLFASGGAAALAAIGLAISAIGVVKDCY